MRKRATKSSRWNGQQACQGGSAAGFVVRHDHLADGADALGVEEHVLGAAEADAFGAELAGGLGVERGFGVGADLHAAGLSAHSIRVPKSPERAGSIIGDAADEDLAGGAVEGDGVAGVDGVAAGTDGLGVVIDGEAPCPGDAGPAHAAGDDGGVAGHAAAGGDDAAGGVHAVDVLGAGLDAHQDDGFALGGAGFGLVGAEHDGAARRRRGWRAGPCRAACGGPWGRAWDAATGRARSG